MLFNKNENGSEELTNITGQWYAKSSYQLIETEVDFAIRELRGRFGDGVIEAAESAYADGNNNKLVKAVQLPAACLAIMRYMTLSSLSHESTGRKLKMDDNEKIPFEWMIDRDDRAMKERYYRALDQLYTYLQDNGVEQWLASEQYLSCKTSIVKSVREFEEIYPIDGSYYVYYMLQPLVIEAQESELRPLMGEKWPAILDGCADRRILGLARKMAVLSALITAAERWSLEVFPLEIARRFSPSYQGNKAGNSASSNEIEWYIRKLSAQKTKCRAELERLVSPFTPECELLPKNRQENKYFRTL